MFSIQGDVISYQLYPLKFIWFWVSLGRCGKKRKFWESFGKNSQKIPFFFNESPPLHLVWKYKFSFSGDFFSSSAFPPPFSLLWSSRCHQEKALVYSILSRFETKWTRRQQKSTFFAKATTQELSPRWVRLLFYSQHRFLCRIKEFLFFQF